MKSSWSRTRSYSIDASVVSAASARAATWARRGQRVGEQHGGVLSRTGVPFTVAPADGCAEHEVAWLGTTGWRVRMCTARRATTRRTRVRPRSLDVRRCPRPERRAVGVAVDDPDLRRGLVRGLSGPRGMPGQRSRSSRVPHRDTHSRSRLRASAKSRCQGEVLTTSRRGRRR